MSRHKPKEMLEQIIVMLDTPSPLAYISERVQIYENELEEMAELGQVIDGARVWLSYEGSNFPRTDIDNTFSQNEEFQFIVIVYDTNYRGVDAAALGDGGGRPGTLQMIADVQDRLFSIKPFSDAMPIIPRGQERIVIASSKKASAYALTFSTEFDYFGPLT